MSQTTDSVILDDFHTALFAMENEEQGIWHLNLWYGLGFMAGLNRVHLTAGTPWEGVRSAINKKGPYRKALRDQYLQGVRDGNHVRRGSASSR